MFGLDQENLQTLWRITLSAASWKSDLSFEQNTEYLRLKPPFSQGYWVNKPDTTGTVSILRTGMKGSQLYYLYRYYGTTMEVSPLPQWQVEFYNYRSLACACLSTYGTLPPIEYFEDGALVHVHMNYLLPPRELEFLKLYSLDIPDVERNDQVTLLGGTLSIQWMADLLQTNVDEIVCNISQRVPRVYIDSTQES